MGYIENLQQLQSQSQASFAWFVTSFFPACNLLHIVKRPDARRPVYLLFWFWTRMQQLYNCWKTKLVKQRLSYLLLQLYSDKFLRTKRRQWNSHPGAKALEKQDPGAKNGALLTRLPPGWSIKNLRRRSSAPNWRSHVTNPNWTHSEAHGGAPVAVALALPEDASESH